MNGTNMGTNNHKSKRVIISGDSKFICQLERFARFIVFPRANLGSVCLKAKKPRTASNINSAKITYLAEPRAKKLTSVSRRVERPGLGIQKPLLAIENILSLNINIKGMRAKIRTPVVVKNFHRCKGYFLKNIKKKRI